MTGTTFVLVFLMAMSRSSPPDVTIEKEPNSRAFSNSLPDELQFSCAVVLREKEEELAEAMTGADPAKRVVAARALWEGHSRRHSRAVLRLVFSEPLKTNGFAAFKRDVEESQG